MESIESTAKVAIPTMSGSEPPKHVDPDHAKCAFYLNYDVGAMMCQHTEEAGGAFYNEDYFNELRITCQRFYSAMAAGNHKMTPTERTLFMKIRELTK